MHVGQNRPQRQCSMVTALIESILGHCSVIGHSTWKTKSSYLESRPDLSLRHNVPLLMLPRRGSRLSPGEQRIVRRPRTIMLRNGSLVARCPLSRV